MLEFFTWLEQGQHFSLFIAFVGVVTLAVVMVIEALRSGKS